MISIFFQVFFWCKKSFEQSVQLLEKYLSVFWAATTENFDFFYFCFLKKNASHTTSIYEKILIIDLSCNFLYVWNCMESV